MMLLHTRRLRPSGAPRRRRWRFEQGLGYTLIELMIVVAIIGILAAMGIGFSTGFRRRSELNTVAREIYNGLNTARAEALRKGTAAVMQVAPERFYVFRDVGSDWDYGPESLFYTFPVAPERWPYAMTVTVSNNIVVANSGKRLFIFDAQGFLMDVNGEPIAGSVLVDDAKLGETRTIDVTIAGALRIQ